MNFVLNFFNQIRTRIKDIYCKAEEGELDKCTKSFPLNSITVVK